MPAAFPPHLNCMQVIIMGGTPTTNYNSKFTYYLIWDPDSPLWIRKVPLDPLFTNDARWKNTWGGARLCITNISGFTWPARRSLFKIDAVLSCAVRAHPRQRGPC